MNWENVKTFHHRIMMRYLRKRGWVVMHLTPNARKCIKGVCWMEIYNSKPSVNKQQTTKEK